ncbi:MAG TPA: TIGR00282 family metallophosphoesterase [Oscillospiraceae bacterium]|nr:TIGR00282 family metallophosphoesterase [Oscillospiraceae bacterium]HRW57861.1 TIGR00282 family metallophosphoesterase [Oscillospiraceae bacterium]
MRILCFGDVTGKNGCDALRKAMPVLKEQYRPDMTVVNGENSSDNGGITTRTCEDIFSMGADVITNGNHAFQNRDMRDLYEKTDSGVLRPANYHGSAPGTGVYLFEKGKFQAAVVNLMGAVFLDPFESPFLCADRLLGEIDCKTVIVDFHAEATSEKIALAKYLEGRISLLYGTHTHVPTADETILPKGTAFISDIGMCGPIDSVIGVKTEVSTNFMITHLRDRFEIAEGPSKVQGIFVTTDDKTGKALSIERFDFR